MLFESGTDDESVALEMYFLILYYLLLLIDCDDLKSHTVTQLYAFLIC